MKKHYSIFLFLIFISFSFFSCKGHLVARTPNPTPYPFQPENIALSYNEIKDDIDTLEELPYQFFSSFTISNKYLFVSNGDSGIHVIDNTDPKNPKNTSFIRFPNVTNMKVVDNILYASSMGDIAVLDIADIHNVKLLKRVAISEDKSNEFIIIGNKLPKDFTTKNTNKFFEYSKNDLTIIGNYIYYINLKKELVILDISDKSNTKIVNRLRLNITKAESIEYAEIIQSISYSNDMMAVSSHKKLYLYSIKDLKNPVLLSTLDYSQKLRSPRLFVDSKKILSSGTLLDKFSIAMTENKIYLNMDKKYIDIINLDDVSKPKFTNSCEVEEDLMYSNMIIKNKKLFLIGKEVKVFDVSNDLNLNLLGKFNVKSTDFLITDQWLLISLESKKSLYEYDISNITDGLKYLTSIKANSNYYTVVSGDSEYFQEYESYLKNKEKNEAKK